MHHKSRSTFALDVAPCQYQVAMEYSPLLQLSRWISKKANHEYLSLILWLPSDLGTSSTSVKYGLRVVDDGNCLEVSLVWPRTLIKGNVVAEAPLEAGSEMEDSEIFGFNVAVGTAQISSLYSVESKGLIPLPCTVEKHTNKG